VLAVLSNKMETRKRRVSHEKEETAPKASLPNKKAKADSDLLSEDGERAIANICAIEGEMIDGLTRSPFHYTLPPPEEERVRHRRFHNTIPLTLRRTSAFRLRWAALEARIAVWEDRYREVQMRGQKRMEDLYAQADIPFHYAHPLDDDDDDSHDPPSTLRSMRHHPLKKMLSRHVDYFYAHHGGPPETSAAEAVRSAGALLRAWMIEQMPSLDQSSGGSIGGLDDPQVRALGDYCLDGFRSVWDAYERAGANALSSVLSRDGSEDWIDRFDSCFRDLPPLPGGALLFEGQGLYERDIYDLLRSDDGLRIGQAVVRRRPSSTAWLPDAALDFLGHTAPLPPPDDESKEEEEEEGGGGGGGGFVTALRRRECGQDEPNSLDMRCRAERRAAFVFGEYATDGCVVVHRLKEPVGAIYRQGMPGSIFKEAEIILQPRLRLRIVRIDRAVELPHAGATPVKCDVVWTEVVIDG
jgi:hypothetical protein